MNSKTPFKNYIKLTSILLITTLIVIAITAISLGKCTYVNNFKREKYVSSIVKDGYIDSRKYWQFRDRYAPGTVYPNFNNINVRQVLELAKMPNSEPLLIYKSRLIKAVDYVISTDDFEAYWSDLLEEHDEYNHILTTNNGVLYLDNNDNYLLVGYWNSQDLYKTNGLFNYTQNEKGILDKSIWISKAIIAK